MQDIDIIVVTYNRLEFTKKTLESIFSRTKLPYRLIVIDNASTDGTREFLNKLGNEGKIDQVIFNDKNVGLENAWNQGLELVESPLFVTTDNDCIAPDLDPCWLERLVDLMNNHIEFAAIALRPQVLIGVGNIFSEDVEVVENNVCGGSYRIMDLDRVKEVGGWTDKFENNGRGNEEHDVCGKLRNNGYKVGYAKEIFTYHQFGEDNWGYDESIDAAAGRSLKTAPKDQDYNPKTCEPKVRSNE